MAGKGPLVMDRQFQQFILSRLHSLTGVVPMGDFLLEHFFLSRCMTCACCIEACSQVNDRSSFIGPAVIGQVRYFNTHATGRALESNRLDVMMGEGGIHECGNAQNCVEVCPKTINLTDAIADVGRKVTVHAVTKFFKS